MPPDSITLRGAAAVLRLLGRILRLELGLLALQRVDLRLRVGDFGIIGAIDALQRRQRRLQVGDFLVQVDELLVADLAPAR